MRTHFSFGIIGALLGMTACHNPGGAGARDAASRSGPGLPLTLVADVAMPGGATRFDYQDVDTAQGLLVVTHMNDNAVLILDLRDGSVRKQLPASPRRAASRSPTTSASSS